jgi:hypothetical protein
MPPEATQPSAQASEARLVALVDLAALPSEPLSEATRQSVRQRVAAKLDDKAFMQRLVGSRQRHLRAL